ncbi:MAG: amidohydrolase [Paraprevotella sp.]|nr:amidohydrolase [Paraprevotella sp.]
MRITLVQSDIRRGDAEENLRRLDEAMLRHAGTDLFVFPEMFASGFCMQPDAAAESEGGRVQAWMRRRAAERDAALAGSVAVRKADGTLRNRLLLAMPDGACAVYDKRHLFAYGGEDRCYRAGAARTVVCWRGVRILLQVCYDLRFPVWSRNRQDYDLALYVANWPTARIGAWDTLLRARAIENQCYVAGVNRVGADEAGDYCGHSVLVDPLGRALTDEAEGVACERTGVADMEVLRRCREKFPVWADADPFTLDTQPWGAADGGCRKRMNADYSFRRPKE